MKVFFPLALCLFCAFSVSVSAQDLSISIATPTNASVCGPAETATVTVTNNDDETANNVVGNFTNLAEVLILEVQAPATGTPGNVMLGDIAAGETVTFDFTFQAGCDARNLNPANFGFELDLSSDEGTTGNETSGTVEILFADLSLPPPTTPATLEVYQGLEASVNTTVVNGSFGMVTEFSYCVSNNLSNLQLNGILVGGNDITASGVAFVNGNYNCYTVTTADLMAASLGSTLDQLEAVPIEEQWEVTGCSNAPEDIRRRVQYGCQGETDCQMKPDGDFQATPVTYETLFPNVRIATAETNGMTIDASSVVITNEQTGMVIPASEYATSNQLTGSNCQGNGLIRIDYRFNDLILGIGESVTVAYNVVGTCTCNDCNIRNKYFSTVQIRDYDDLCGNTQSDRGSVNPNERYDAFMQGLPEGPTNLNDGQSDQVSYFITDMQLDWLTTEFDNAFLEAIITLPCGLDYVDGSFSWVDRNNTLFPVGNVTYTDVNTIGSEDMLVVRFNAADNPGFSFAGGGNFEYTVVADCGEKDLTSCGNQVFDERIPARFELTTDPTCNSDCTPQKIFQPDTLDVRLSCIDFDQCPECDGIQFVEFNVLRSNFGVADTDNNQIPNGSAPADPNDAQADRYLRGDSLRATFQGIVRDLDNDQDFDFGFIEFPLEHGDFTPLGATVTITDATDGMVYVCNAVPLAADGPNQQMIIDFSVAALQGFGCGLPVGFTFDEGDIIDAKLDFTEKNELAGEQFVVRDYIPRFYVSETGPGSGGQCNPLNARMTQVGFFTDFNNVSADFGACDRPGWTLTYSRYVGGPDLDEFANEIRPIALPDRLVFTKPSEFIYRLDEWRVTLEQQIEPDNNIVNNTTIPMQYFVLNGDEVTFLAGDYFKSLNNPEIFPDEGYRVVIQPRIQGNCESIAAEYNYGYEFFEEVDANIFCTAEIARPPFAGTFEYTGAATLVVESVEDNIRLCSGNEEANIRVRNVSTPNATNSFFYPQPTGQVIVNRVEDSNGNEIIPNAFGLYPLGTINGQSTVDLVVFFTKNTCEGAFIDFIAGWDCDATPETIADATCADPSRVALTNAQSNVDMVVTRPARSSTEIIALCDPITFEADIVSSDLGYVRDIVLTFSLPPSVTYETGTFQLAVPSIGLGGSYAMTIDPTAIGANQYQIDISALNTILDTEGLVGSKFLPSSVISITFDATTDCGYLSGTRAIFSIESNNSCGDPLPGIVRESGRIRTSDREEDISVSVVPSDVVFNACNDQTETLNVSVAIGGADLSAVDSIRVLLPPGIEYVADSYVPVQNAAPGNNPGAIRDFNGQTGLLFPLAQPANGETDISFDLDIIPVDVGQLCQNYPVIVDVFAAIEDECNGDICQSNEIRGEAISNITVQKPDLEFTSIDGDITLNPGDGTATADFTTTVVNNGYFLASGNAVTIAIYEDVNNNGSFDEGTDEFLFTLSEVLTDDLNPGESITLTGMATFPAANVCTVIGVIDPDRTCTCSTRPSATFRPEIIYEFERDYAVCSGETVDIGPDPVTGYTYEWISVDGSDVANLSPTDQAQTTFTAPANNTGAPISVKYAVRVANAPCFANEEVTITIAPALNETTNVLACQGTSYTLPSTTQDGATNFSWMPSAGLTISNDGSTATVDDVQTGINTYTLTYEVGDGCAAMFTVNLTGANCGITEAAVGDYVWFDFNGDGVQGINEPPVEGVTVYLINGNTGAIISSTMTDVNGLYLFDGLPAGNYAVQFVAPGGFTFTSNETGNDDTDDSDADPTTGQTPALFVPLDSTDLNFDGGFIPDCTLELELTVGDCAPSGDTLARQLLLTATWTGNPYTYDQFDDGNDTLDVTIGGETYAVVISDLDGTVTVIDSLVAPASTTDYSVTAVFRESTACTASATAPAFAPCVFDLALTKTASTLQPTPGPYAYGDTVCMDIVVVNQGEQSVSNVQIFDSLPAGLAFNGIASDLGWVSIAPLQLFTLSGPIAPTETATVTICANIVRTDGGAVTVRPTIISATIMAGRPTARPMTSPTATPTTRPCPTMRTTATPSVLRSTIWHSSRCWIPNRPSRWEIP